MTWALPVSINSGSVPIRPTSVMRASCDGRVVENARCARVGVARPARLAGDRRKDMAEKDESCGLRRQVK